MCRPISSLALWVCLQSFRLWIRAVYFMTLDQHAQHKEQGSLPFCNWPILQLHNRWLGLTISHLMCCLLFSKEQFRWENLRVLLLDKNIPLWPGLGWNPTPLAVAGFARWHRYHHLYPLIQNSPINVLYHAGSYTSIMAQHIINLQSTLRFLEVWLNLQKVLPDDLSCSEFLLVRRWLYVVDCCDTVCQHSVPSGCTLTLLDTALYVFIYACYYICMFVYHIILRVSFSLVNFHFLGHFNHSQ